MFGSDDLDQHCFAKPVINVHVLNSGGHGSKDIVHFFKVPIFLV